MMLHCNALQVQICERNHQPSDDVMSGFRIHYLCGAFCLQVVVSLVALSHDGSMMSTVETRLAEDGVGGLVCLKFWVSETQKKDFKLSTIVYEPHRFVFSSLCSKIVLIVCFVNVSISCWLL
ncbi:WD repeat-containing protein 75 [Bienertia sinuspersici]